MPAQSRKSDSTQMSSSEILEINFFDHCAKSRQFDAWQTEDSHQKQRRLFRSNICLEVMLFVVALLRNFSGAATLLSIITVAE